MVLIKNLEQFEKAKISKEQSAMVALFLLENPYFGRVFPKCVVGNPYKWGLGLCFSIFSCIFEVVINR